MNIALLFDADHDDFGGIYGDPVMGKILATGVLQTIQRSMRISIGDVLTFMRGHHLGREGHSQLCQRTYSPAGYDNVLWDRLEPTFEKSTVYVWLFQNMTPAIADRLHAIMASDETYLGALGVDFSIPEHLQLFRNSLIERYRFVGRNVSVFGDEEHEEDPDVVIKNILEKNGFHKSYECIGLRRTYFDSYDTLDHFQRVRDFSEYFRGIKGLDTDVASEITLHVEELHPKLFDGFAAAARALARAETSEDFAQAAISGRRLLERTADYLFPPSDTPHNGRTVGKAAFRNRLWAYVETTLSKSGGDLVTLNWLGREADRLVELFNSGLHSDINRDKVESAFRDLVIWMSNVIAIDPAAIRRPYLAYDHAL